MTNLPGDPKSYEITYDLARAGIDHQTHALDEARGRGGLLFGAGSIAASFLGGIALSDNRIGLAGVVAVILFVGVAGAAFIVLRPYGDWRFILSAQVLIDGWVEGSPPASAAEMHRQLAVLLLSNQAHNQRKIDELWATYSLGLWFLVGMIVAWMMELAGLTVVAGA